MCPSVFVDACIWIFTFCVLSAKTEMPGCEDVSKPSLLAVTSYVSGESETNEKLPEAPVGVDTDSDGAVAVTLTPASGVPSFDDTTPLSAPVVPARTHVPCASSTNAAKRAI